MHILVYSYFAPLRDHLAGGVQRFLNDILKGIVDAGHNVTVLSTEPDNNDELLDLGSRFFVLPVLREPTTGSLTPYERHYNAQYYSKLANSADVVLSIDRSVPIETETPVLLSLNNFSYSTEVESVFSFRWDAMIVPSIYERKCVEAIVGSDYWSEGQRPIYTIPLPVDTCLFRRTDPTILANRLGVSANQFIVVYPHRPDPLKGLRTAVEAIDYASRLNPRIMLYVPSLPYSVRAVRQREQAFLDEVNLEITKRNLNKFIKFHPWIDSREMPAYFSLANCCLALSTLPETFGLSVLQSVACLTPVVTTPAGAIPEVLPPYHGVNIVDFDSPEKVADAMLQQHDPADLRRGKAYIEANYNVESVVSQYLGCLASITKSHAQYNPEPKVRNGLVPWCREQSDGRIWHDYEKRYLSSEEVEMRESLVSTGQIEGSERDLLLRRGLISGFSKPNLCTKARSEDS